MVKKTHTQQHTPYRALSTFVLGAFMGFILGIGSLPTTYDAALLRPNLRLERLRIRQEKNAEQAKLTKAMLLRAARRQGIRLYTVADARLHTAAPLQSIAGEFPPFVQAIFPVSKIPNWGAMRTAKEWNRTYDNMTDADFVPVPDYDLKTLTIPMTALTKNLASASSIAAITAKLFYSTRFMGTYDIDAGEYTGNHQGIDLKLAPGTPVGAIGGGRIVAVETSATLGLHVIIEHHLTEGTYYSVYGHFETTTVRTGDAVTPGQIIGTVGMTGNTSAPHLHLQVENAERTAINPITFIATH